MGVISEDLVPIPVPLKEPLLFLRNWDDIVVNGAAWGESFRFFCLCGCFAEGCAGLAG